MREWVGSVPRQQQDETSFYMHTLQPLHENHLVWRRGDGEGSDKYKIKKKTPSDHLLLPCKYQATATSEAAQSVWWADTNGVIGKWFWDGGGETEDGRTWRINNDELSGTYAVTFINSLLMTYLAVVGLTCVYCVNVQTLRWGQMFGRHVCTLINSVHAQRSCVCVWVCARTQTSTPTIPSTHTQTHTHGLSHSTSSGSRGGKSHLFPSLLVDICPVSSLNRPLAPEQTRAPSFKHHRKIFNILKWDWVGNLLDDNGRRKTGVTKRIARR